MGYIGYKGRERLVQDDNTSRLDWVGVQGIYTVIAIVWSGAMIVVMYMVYFIGEIDTIHLEHHRLV